MAKKKINKQRLKVRIWKLTKLLNKLLYQYDGDEPNLSLKVVDYLQEGGN